MCRPRSTIVKQTLQLTALIEREDDGFVALCPELDIASQGGTVGEARRNLIEALELVLEEASATELQQRLRSKLHITRWEAG